MEIEDQSYLRDFFQAVVDRPLEPDNKWYVPIYDDPEIASEDPVELLARGIEWTPGQSVQLLSGFRGTGKSTELRRLRRRLRETGFLVALVDIEDFVNLSTPVDISDFLMAVTGAFSEELKHAELLGSSAASESYWERLVAFLTKTRVEIEELRTGPEALGLPVQLKSALKSDPTFKQKLQQRMAGHLGALVRDVQEFFQEVVRRLKARHGDERDVVLLVDSMEHIRGTFANAAEVHRSVETLFAGQADKLHLPNLHVVYTVPPYLKVLYANLSGLYAPGGLHLLPAVKLRDDEGRHESRAGFDALERVVAARGDWRRLLGERAALDALSRMSGGHLRDLLRLLAEVIRRADRLPVARRVVEAAIHQMRNEFLPIADRDARWLARVAQTHSASLVEAERLPDLARFLDTHMMLCYRNGHEWYDVHPLIAEQVEQQAARVEAEDAEEEAKDG